MRYINFLLCIVMIVFAAVQYNDPDGLFWATAYLVPALFAGLAALRLPVLRGGPPLVLLIAATALGLAGVVWFWPQTPGFWHESVWWNTETAREGMGVMVAATVLIIALLTALTARARPH